MKSIVTIYNGTDRFPDSYVARRHTVGPAASFATADYQISPSVEPLRDWAKSKLKHFNGSEPTNFGRKKVDPPHIIESWI